MEVFVQCCNFVRHWNKSATKPRFEPFPSRSVFCLNPQQRIDARSSQFPEQDLMFANQLCTNSVHSYFIPRVHQWCWVLDCSCWSLAQLGAVMFTLNSWVQSCSHWTAAHWTAGCSHVHTEQMGAVMFTMNSLAWWLLHPQGDTSLLSSVFINFHDLDRLPRVFLHKNNRMACYETMG